MKKMIMMGVLLFTAAQTSWAMEAEHHHDSMNHAMDHSMDHSKHGEKQQMDMADDKNIQSKKSENTDKPAMFLVKQEVDGYTVSFHVMPAGGMYHGGSHNLMIKIEKDGKDEEILSINSKVFFPDGSSDTKMLIKMGEWYMNGYELGDEGRYGLMTLFKTADGKKHKASVYYPENK